MARESMLDTSVPALVVRQEWNPAHHATLAVIRSLGRVGVAVHAVLEGPRIPAARSRYLARRLPWWPTGSDAGRRIEILAGAAAEIGGQPVLYAMDDASALLVAEYADELKAHVRLPGAASPHVPGLVADKLELAELCDLAGVTHPDCEIPDSEQAARAAASRFGLPLIAKWARPWLLPPGPARAAGPRPLRSTEVVTAEAQVVALFRRREEAGSPLLLQRLIPATPGGDRFFHGYFGADAYGAPVCRYGAAGIKELSWPRSAGLTARGSWLADERIEAAGRAVAAAAGYTGLLDLDLRWDPRAGDFALLDFNPRLGAQFRLFADSAGLDLPRAAHLDLTGRPVPAARPRPGRRFVVETYDPLGAARTLLPHRRGAAELAYLCADDPAPFAAAAARTLRRATARLYRSHDPIPEGTAPTAVDRDKVEQ